MENQLKARLKAGEICRGIWLSLASAEVAEIAGGAGFDWCLIDCEHAPNSLDSVAHQLRALELMGVPAVVRPPVGETWVLKQLLDLGAQTLLVPMVDSADHAREMVAAVRYAPRGRRGVAAAIVRASQYGRRADYMARADEEICLIVQAESRAAMANLDEIAAVEGVDAVFIGPADLSADMGHPGAASHPDVVAAIEDGIARIHKAGKAAGILVGAEADMQKYAAQGVEFLGIGSDVALLRGAFDDVLARARG